jgi:uncharacterized protein (DUF305 family)
MLTESSFLPALLRAVACMVCVVALVAIVPSFAQRGSDGTRLQRSHGPSENDWSELMASMDKMHGAIASIKSSGDSDVDFVKLMLPHHQAALDMAKAELMHGQDPQMRRLAQEIITDQESEIELMQLWLKQHDGQKSKPATSAVKEQ